MSILGMVLITGSLDLNGSSTGRTATSGAVFAQPLGFLLFLISAFAETNRLPFDLPESEQELVGGFHTEYSAMKFGMFFLGEYLHVITVSFLTVDPLLRRLGPAVRPRPARQTGWLWALAQGGVMLGKVAAMIVFIMWIRWTLPRFRYDTLMDLAWKRMIPLSLINLVGHGQHRLDFFRDYLPVRMIRPSTDGATDVRADDPSMKRVTPPT